jgi:hypothetical protein
MTTRVFIEGGAISSGARLRGPLAEDEAARALKHLIDAGHELVFVGVLSDVPAALQSAFGRVVDAEDALPADSWLLTADAARCGRSSPSVRTILVGGWEGELRPVQRCDSVARDLMTAVIEILASEAMPRPTANRA